MPPPCSVVRNGHRPLYFISIGFLRLLSLLNHEVSTGCGKGQSHDAIKTNSLKTQISKVKSETELRGLSQTPSRRVHQLMRLPQGQLSASVPLLIQCTFEGMDPKQSSRKKKSNYQKGLSSAGGRAQDRPVLHRRTVSEEMTWE